MNCAAASSMTTVIGGNSAYPKTSPLTERDANASANSRTSPAIYSCNSPVVAKEELDEEAQLEAEITICARNALNLFAVALLNEVIEPDNKSAPEGKLVLHMVDVGADTEAAKAYVHKRPIDIDRFVRRYIFNVRDKYLSKLDEDSADSFADGCLRVLEKVQEIAGDRNTALLSRILDEKLGVPDIAYKCFIAEILAHPGGGVYQETPLANARAFADIFKDMPILKGEMESIWSAN
jgi:hypothetical protein